jgi:hypothetical protein
MESRHVLWHVRTAGLRSVSATMHRGPDGQAICTCAYASGSSREQGEEARESKGLWTESSLRAIEISFRGF